MDYKTMFKNLYAANHKAIRVLRQAQQQVDDLAMDEIDPLSLLQAMEVESEPETAAACGEASFME